MKSLVLIAIAVLFAIPSFANLSVMPSYISFGTVKLGSYSFNQRTITISNNSKDAVDVQVNGYCSPDFRVSGFCGRLNQYASCNITMQFSPSREGSHHCNLSVRDNKGSYTTISANGSARK